MRSAGKLRLSAIKKKPGTAGRGAGGIIRDRFRVEITVKETNRLGHGIVDVSAKLLCFFFIFFSFVLLKIKILRVPVSE